MTASGRCIASPLCPLLYPVLHQSPSPHLRRSLSRLVSRQSQTRLSSTTASTDTLLNARPQSHLNPTPDDFAAPKFADKAQITLYAGKGGNGCISFLREAYFPDGPPNGGDGGAGGNIYIQAAHGETSLHKLARRQFARAGRGKHGQGSAKGGSRGEDIVITVPVGTIVRELSRHDPAAEEAERIRAWKLLQKERKRNERLSSDLREQSRRALAEDGVETEPEEGYELQNSEEAAEQEEIDQQDPQRDKWLLYPGLSKNDMKSDAFPKLPTRTRYLQQPQGPLYFDLSRPTPRPILLATGGVGGLGNPHFTSMKHPRPLFATRGDEAVTMRIELELKLLADVGLVGLPNAGKSTLLRAITNSRTRVGNWAFTTLQPNIGTVILDKYSGRPETKTFRRYPAEHGLPSLAEAEPRTRFTVADIPGLIEGAHLDRGLGIAFLRHVERAGVLAFVIDLNAGDAVRALDALWNEVGLYARIRAEEEAQRLVDGQVDWNNGAALDPVKQTVNLMDETWDGGLTTHEPFSADQVAGKPWFVVATKADLPDTQENFQKLQTYLDEISSGQRPHPCGSKGGWTRRITAIPVSAINSQGVDRVVKWTVGLLDT